MIRQGHHYGIIQEGRSLGGGYSDHLIIMSQGPSMPQLSESCASSAAQSSRRRVPPSQPADSQAAKMLLMSGCCFQSQFLLGKQAFIQFLHLFDHQVSESMSGQQICTDVPISARVARPSSSQDPSQAHCKRRSSFPVH